MEALLEHEGAAETGPLDDARGEDLQGLAHSYDMEPRPGHLESEALGRSGFPSREAIASLRSANVPDAVLMAHMVREADVKFLPRRRWEYARGGIPAILLMVPNAWGEVVDVVGWPIARPDKWARLTGRAAMLGEAALDTAFTDPVEAYRTPLGWLAGGAAGICILDGTYAWKKLRTGPPISGEDLEHAKEIEAMLAPPVAPRIYVRQPHHGRKAA